ncbi:MAG: aminotransferase class I/II-fold pyridoxal phosphate-dependent enzyme, partial [Atribacterota bacterium]
MKATVSTKRVANLKACVADRVCRLRGEGAFEILALVKQLEKQGKDIIHLEIGEPDFDTPENVKEKAIQAIREGHTYYVPSAGIDELREAVCVYMKRSRGIDVSPEEVIITPGAKPVIFLSFLLLLEEGDEVIYPDPGFPAYRSIIDFVGAKAVPLRLREEHDFRIDVDELRRLVTPRTKMIVLNSPGNPTGSVLTREDMAEIARLAEEEDLLIFTDEVYSEIIYDEP